MWPSFGAISRPWERTTSFPIACRGLLLHQNLDGLQNDRMLSQKFVWLLLDRGPYIVVVEKRMHRRFYEFDTEVLACFIHLSSFYKTYGSSGNALYIFWANSTAVYLPENVSPMLPIRNLGFRYLMFCRSKKSLLKVAHL